jgi:DNA-binding transcriptional LysR family regulator
VLFERIGRGIRLTEAGRRFLPEARAVLARAEAAARLLVGDFADLSRGRLSLSASQTLANYWRPSVMVRFHKAHPGIDVALAIGNSAQVAADVLDLRADLGFVEGPTEPSGLVATSLGGDELWLVVAPGHPWASAPPGPADLTAGIWVLREPGSGTRMAMEAAEGIPGAALADRIELTSNEAVRTAVRAGGGATILPRLVVGASCTAGELVRVEFPPFHRRFHQLRHPARHVTAAVAAFAALAAAE